MKTTFEICNSFNKAANEYDAVAKVQYEIGLRLLERLDYLKIKPRYVLDLGSGTGFFTSSLKKHYPKAEIVAFDIARQMLLKGKKKQGFLSKWRSIVGDMNAMPFATGVFDLIFSNQAIHWAYSLPHLFGELNRIMNSNGCLMFSSLGPDTFLELKKAWAKVDSHAHVIDFLDMHDLGDILLKEQFLDPVVDMEKLEVHYDSLDKLVKSLKKQGVRNLNVNRNQGLTGKNAWKNFEKEYEQFKAANKYPLTYEVVYGHAWKGSQYRNQGVTETRISVDSIKKRSGL